MTTGPNFSHAVWRKSSRSGTSNGGGDANCVEIAYSGSTAGVRDSKRPSAGHLIIDASLFARFLASAKRGDSELR